MVKERTGYRDDNAQVEASKAHGFVYNLADIGFADLETDDDGIPCAIVLATDKEDDGILPIGSRTQQQELYSCGKICEKALPIFWLSYSSKRADGWKIWPLNSCALFYVRLKRTISETEYVQILYDTRENGDLVPDDVKHELESTSFEQTQKDADEKFSDNKVPYRFRWYSTRHRKLYGGKCHMINIDDVLINVKTGEPKAFIEYKASGYNKKHAKYGIDVLGYAGELCGIPSVLSVHDLELSEFMVSPINGLAFDFFEAYNYMPGEKLLSDEYWIFVNQLSGTLTYEDYQHKRME